MSKVNILIILLANLNLLIVHIYTYRDAKSSLKISLADCSSQTDIVINSAVHESKVMSRAQLDGVINEDVSVFCRHPIHVSHLLFHLENR